MRTESRPQQVRGGSGTPRRWLRPIRYCGCWASWALPPEAALILLTLPVLTIPSPVLLSIVFREELGTSGTAPSFDVLTAVVAAITGIGVLVAILVSAWAELHAVERCGGRSSIGNAAPGTGTPDAGVS